MFVNKNVILQNTSKVILEHNFRMLARKINVSGMVMLMKKLDLYNFIFSFST